MPSRPPMPRYLFPRRQLLGSYCAVTNITSILARGSGDTRRGALLRLLNAATEEMEHCEVCLNKPWGIEPLLRYLQCVCPSINTLPGRFISGANTAVHGADYSHLVEGAYAAAHSLFLRDRGPYDTGSSSSRREYRAVGHTIEAVVRALAATYAGRQVDPLREAFWATIGVLSKVRVGVDGMAGALATVAFAREHLPDHEWTYRLQWLDELYTSELMRQFEDWRSCKERGAPWHAPISAVLRPSYRYLFPIQQAEMLYAILRILYVTPGIDWLTPILPAVSTVGAETAVLFPQLAVDVHPSRNEVTVGLRHATGAVVEWIGQTAEGFRSYCKEHERWCPTTSACFALQQAQVHARLSPGQHSMREYFLDAMEVISLWWGELQIQGDTCECCREARDHVATCLDPALWLEGREGAYAMLRSAFDEACERYLPWLLEEAAPQEHAYYAELSGIEARAPNVLWDERDILGWARNDDIRPFV